MQALRRQRLAFDQPGLQQRTADLCGMRGSDGIGHHRKKQALGGLLFAQAQRQLRFGGGQVQELLLHGINPRPRAPACLNKGGGY
ncbi:hypothetical protein Xcc3_29300 [Xanthomonas campestris pv. campestris]|nr:hypothetical protein Xcc3_29300 [Xanthomonas campestris pv. campestris]